MKEKSYLGFGGLLHVVDSSTQCDRGCSRRVRDQVQLYFTLVLFNVHSTLFMSKFSFSSLL